MSTTPTPRSDAAARAGAYYTGPGEDYESTCGKQIVHLNFARQLERELAEALRERGLPPQLYDEMQRERDNALELLREIRGNEVNAQDEADKFLRDHQPSELSKLRSENERLRSSLNAIRQTANHAITTKDQP